MKFTEDHEWIRVEGDVGVVGITKYAAEQLGDVVFAEPPEIGRQVKKGDDLAVVESVKAASDIYAPVAGEVVERNDVLDDADQATVINEDPEGAGWFCKLKLADAGELDGLMDAAAYAKFCEGL
ncbi:MAG: glycine cleavage system protein GcvH [Pseudomonadota bacterium]